MAKNQCWPPKTCYCTGHHYRDYINCIVSVFQKWEIQTCTLRRCFGKQRLLFLQPLIPNVLPVPVAPLSTWYLHPFSIRDTRVSIHSCWSPAGSKELNLKAFVVQAEESLLDAEVPILLIDLIGVSLPLVLAYMPDNRRSTSLSSNVLTFVLRILVYCEDSLPNLQWTLCEFDFDENIHRRAVITNYNLTWLLKSRATPTTCKRHYWACSTLSN